MEQVSVRARGTIPTAKDARKRPSPLEATAVSSKPGPKPRPTAAAESLTVVPDEWTNVRATAQAQRAANARQASGRRRFVDPTTCERDYTMEELEFMAAMQQYKKESGRNFPTWSEILEVLTLRLGYRKLAGAETDEIVESRPKAATAAR